MTFAGLISSKANQHSTVVQTPRVNIDAGRAERDLIAGKPHDTLPQGFCAVSMQLQVGVSQPPADAAAKPPFNGLVQLVHHALEEGRLAVQGLRSGHQEPGLGHALARVPGLLGLEAAVKFRVVVEGRQRELKAGLPEEIYRIGCEAIVNAYRHSGAQKIEAQIVYRPTELRVTVRDNGCGIDSRNLRCGRMGYWGLQGMRELAKLIGAEFRIMSRTAMGTDVELCVPGRVAFSMSPAVC